MDDWAGFGVRGYRSFGHGDLAYVGPMEKVHLVVGRNNVGKSNLLHFMHDFLPQFRSNPAGIEQALFPRREDTPIPWDSTISRSFSLGLRMSERLTEAFQLDAGGNELAEVFAQQAYSRGSDGIIWFDFNLVHISDDQRMGVPSLDQFMEATRQAGKPLSDLSDLSLRMTSSSSSDPQTNLNGIFGRARPWELIPVTAWVDAIRELTAGSDGTGLRNGRGLIQELALLERPPIATRTEDQAKFRALEAFVCDVIDDPTARLEIPQARDTIHVVTAAGRAMALDSLGTGISEVVMIAAVATITRETLVCIEEPEIHLHPSLQRKLISYLHRKTDNRYLISTHSAALLNAELASISHVTNDGAFSSVKNVASPATLAHAVSDLGNKASDLVQSNFLIWVEGPSDRIYMNTWLNARHPDLIEAAHYSIMFYGGALLNHLAVDDRETREFISLLKINRNLALIIDSDRKKATDGLNKTKERVLTEMNDIGAKSWVTDGYTVENYVRHDVLASVIEAEYPQKSYKVPTSRFKSPLASTFLGEKTKPSKITVARAIADLDLSADQWHDDLWPHVDEIAGAIRVANDLKQSQPLSPSNALV